MTASRRRPVAPGRVSSAFALSCTTWEASGSALDVGGAWRLSSAPAEAADHWPTPNPTRPTASTAARALYFSLSHIMARTTPSAKKTACPETPARAGDTPARMLAAARAVAHTHVPLTVTVVGTSNSARAAGDTP